MNNLAFLLVAISLAFVIHNIWRLIGYKDYIPVHIGVRVWKDTYLPMQHQTYARRWYIWLCLALSFVFPLLVVLWLWQRRWAHSSFERWNKTHHVEKLKPVGRTSQSKWVPRLA